MVRSARAYVASFGTAGTLVAGAAVLFVIASAVVSFRGWPAVTDHASGALVTLPASQASPASPATAGRRLAAAIATTRSTGRAGTAGRGAARPTASGKARGGTGAPNNAR